jgi:wyosine [tRNA(Phe)-imidazoG37] synthetase (radical SAM superfamily)
LIVRVAPSNSQTVSISTEKAKIETAKNNPFGCPRNFVRDRLVYTVISSRAGGLSVSVNLNPDKYCNFDCVYCEVDRTEPGGNRWVDATALYADLTQVLKQVHEGRLREIPSFKNLPEELLQLRHVALSGDGEPTLCPNFSEVVQTVVRIRASGGFPFFKMVLITNASGLSLEQVTHGLGFLTSRDEIWAKLDAGTEEYMARVNKPDVTLEFILANILDLARKRPVIIQSLFPKLNGVGPSVEKITQYVRRLKELKESGAQIPLVQIYSATRPTHNSECEHLSLPELSQIALKVRQVTGLRAEVF